MSTAEGRGAVLRLIAMGAMAALHARETSGLGQEVQSALFENNVFLVAQHMMQFDVTGQPALPFAPITRPQDLLDDPHLNASGGLAPLTLPDGRRRPWVAFYWTNRRSVKDL